MILFAVIVTALYVFVMLFLLFGIRKLANSFGRNPAPKCAFSIVIPFRNEAENLPQLLESLALLKYPRELFEILLVNDASADDSEEICREFVEKHSKLQIKILQNEINSGSPKKDAVKKAILEAQGDYILTTDADCVVPENWLREFNSHITETGAAVVAAPVKLASGKHEKETFLESFQKIDNFSLQAATMGGFGVEMPLMCNAANFCYSKEAFIKVNGFNGNDNIAGGDDIFLLEKFKKYGYKSSFLKSENAVVVTQAQPNLKSLFFQRIRWAGKTAAYKSNFAKFTGILVLLMNLLTATAALAVAIGELDVQVFLMIFLFKFNVDFLLIYGSAKFFDQEKLMKSYFWCSLVYPFFSSAVGICSVFMGYTWKDRHFKK